MAPGRVLLVYPPFGALSFPSIGLSLLKSTLHRAGIACDIRYLNYDFLDRLPGPFLDRLGGFDAISRRNELSVGDWAFNGCVFAPDVTARLDERFARFVRAQGESAAFVDRCFAIKAAAAPFVDWAMDALPWHQYDVVGFHSIFNQTMASVALAKAIKRRWPRVVTLFGGPGASDQMGIEIVRQFPQIDYAVHGEADETIVPIVRGLLDGTSIARIDGVIARTGERGPLGEPLVTANPIRLVRDVDSLPVPAFDDFFARFNGRGYEPAIDVFLPIENSRGCWWGAKHHCTFCGLDAATMTFRRKQADTVFAELVHQSARYGIRSFRCVDSILEMSYFRDLIPRLRDANLGLRLFYEVKANLTREQVHLLASAGITLLQPGLEHLSTAVLKLMRKGTTSLQNVQFLKWARERNVTVFWSILFGFPGETLDDYRDIAAMMPALHHLFPPKGPVRVRIDRFSPLFTTPSALGLSIVTPAAAYHHVYPFDDDVLGRLAYYFEGSDRKRDPDLTPYIESDVAARMREWNDRFFRGHATLVQLAGARRLLVYDTRTSERYLLVDGLVRAAIAACAAATGKSRLEQLVSTPEVLDAEALLGLTEEDFVIDRALEEAGRAGVEIVRPPRRAQDSLDAALEWLLDERLMLVEGDRYLALPCQLTAADSGEAGGAYEEGLRNLAATRSVVLEGIW